ncbi:arginase [Halomicrobium zhouii]|uniref:Arginase n=1 Tax=Halomicrobium zhouii TaxID=767519 RepID=A0A1I6LT04_9EURY|nr:arginase [Halomicrobium zhouii]SFS06392.1 arginase [Halomicrobium zhouii]
MTRTVRIVGVPMDLGADRRGVDMGPSAIRYAGLADQLEATGLTCIDDGDVAVPRPEERDPDAAQPTDGQAKYLAETETVTDRVADAVSDAVSDGQLPLVLGGDHSIAIGSVAGAADADDLGILWFDAHGDFNTPQTTPSGNVHGMSLAAILGIGPFEDEPWAVTPEIDPANVALVGLRDLDDEEKRLIRESDVTAYTMSDVDDRGVTDVVDDALSVATEGTDGVHVSLDMDWLDPTEAPGVGTPVRGGVSYREAHVAMEYVADVGDQLRSFELVEVNPILDQHNQTAELGCELVASAFGKRIL